MDEDEADFDCNKGPDSAGWMIGFTVRSGGINFLRDPKLEEGGFPYQSGYRHGVAAQNFITLIAVGQEAIHKQAMDLPIIQSSLILDTYLDGVRTYFL